MDRTLESILLANLTFHLIKGDALVPFFKFNYLVNDIYTRIMLH